MGCYTTPRVSILQKVISHHQQLGFFREQRLTYTKGTHQMTTAQILSVYAGYNISDLNCGGRLAIPAQLCFRLGLCLNRGQRDGPMHSWKQLRCTEMFSKETVLRILINCLPMKINSFALERDMEIVGREKRSV